MTTQKPEALRLADKYEVEGFLQDHRFAQDHWCRQAALELRRLHAENEALQAQLESIGAGGVEPLRKINSLEIRVIKTHHGKLLRAALQEAEAALEIALARILKRDPGHSVNVTSEAKALVIVRNALDESSHPDHFRDAAEMVPVALAIGNGTTPYELWHDTEELLDLEVKRLGGTACKMKLYAQVAKWKHTSK